jgi:hypothetical protein
MFSDNPVIRNKLISEETKLKKKFSEIFYSLEGYLKYKYFHKYEVDEFNKAVLDELETHVKVKERLYYSIFFWNAFYILTLKYIMKVLYFNKIYQFIIFSSIFVPYVFFYFRKLKSNRIQMQNALILHYLKQENIIQLKNNFYEINHEFIPHFPNAKNASSKDNLQNINEVEKFLEDYYNNATYGKFLNLKI